MFPPSLFSLSPSYFSMCCRSYCHSCSPPLSSLYHPVISPCVLEATVTHVSLPLSSLSLISPCVVEATVTDISLSLSSLSPSYFSMCCRSYCHSCFPLSLSLLYHQVISLCVVEATVTHVSLPLFSLSPSYFSLCCRSYCHSCFPLSLLSITQLFLLVL